MKRINIHQLMIDAIQRKIMQTQDDLQHFADEFNQCQEALAKCLERRIQLEAENQILQLRNSQLETELQTVKASLQEATAALEEGKRLCKATEHAHESNQESVKRSTDILDRVARCEKTLKKCVDANVKLRGGQGARCETCNELLSSEDTAFLESKFKELYIQLEQSEERAQDIEEQVQRLEEAAKRFDERCQERMSNRMSELD